MSTPAPLRYAALLASATALLSGTALAQAPAAAAAPEPDWTFTGNVGLYSQYVFRGVSQTNEKPAVQGGFDLGHKSGFYAGTWASNISWLSDAAPVSASLEWDLYGGYKGSLPADFGYDLGALYYYYPGNYPIPGYTKPDTLELYAALTWKFLSLKYSYSADNKTFGVPNSRGSDYLDLTANYDVIDKVNDVIGKVTLTGHVGHQRYKGTTHDINTSHSNGDLSYTDWKVGASTEVYGLTVGVYYTDTNADQALYTNPFGKKIADSQFVGFIQKTF
ncbi:MAG: TorF family putative porin [Betaproteobacteria bacterium]